MIPAAHPLSFVIYTALSFGLIDTIFFRGYIMLFRLKVTSLNRRVTIIISEVIILRVFVISVLYPPISALFFFPFFFMDFENIMYLNMGFWDEL